jgi:hypothetical protein
MSNMSPDNMLTVLAAMFSIGFVGFGIVAILATLIQTRRQQHK